MSITVRTHSAEQTRRLGATLAQVLQPGDIIWLRGDLGAGKTTLAQGIARGLGVNEPVLSPTFTLIREHRGRLPFFHADAYRLEGAEQAADLGLQEYFERGGVFAIEWAEHIADALPEERLEVLLEGGADEHRLITLTAYGERYKQRWKQLEETLASAGFRDNR
ncbi:MAG: tRNA (adenosine(37)-N6)-threonylcarbamoyltransferase complex ATPase subunit type 1 TsaE [Armatimonadota bacterium]|nr:MAG: tRNA (adenosine(37)-N6)-threonylcarbamoyltransferase complex ATPase subunit type 1 TsaE [Armatimonadota bacterium]